MRRSILLSAILLAAGPASAQSDPPAPGVIDNLAECLGVTDDAERLACYDAAARSLVDARDTGELVAVERDDVRELERESFGLSLSGVGRLVSQLSPLGGEAEPEEALDRVQLTIESVSEYAPGKRRFVFQNGQVWDQLAPDRIYLPRDPSGIEVEIRSASLGSFLMRVNGVDLRVRRTQ